MISNTFQPNRLLALSTATVMALCLNVQPVECADPPPVSPTATATPSASQKIGIVNFRKIIETSKIGKQQQVSFDGMKNQMESLLRDREKSLADLINKLEDTDYMDGLTPEKELALKQQAYQMDQELEQAKQQFLQTLQQANARIIQMLSEDISKVAEEVCKARGLDCILNQETTFYHKPALDVTDAVIQKLNESFESKQKQTPSEAQKSPDQAKPDSHKS